MDLKNIYCTISIGPTIAVPLPAMMMEALENIEVIHRDNSRSGFQITFQVGRGSSLGAFDYMLLEQPLLKAFNRVVISTTINANPQKLMDGIITHVQLNPGNEPGSGRLVITGEDISIMMDMEEKIVGHPALTDYAIVNKIIESYKGYKIFPEVVLPPVLDSPNPLQVIPMQHETDLVYLKRLAARYGYVFYVDTGSFVNTAYWGPPKRTGEPQSALCVAIGFGRNINSIHFNYDALAPVMVSGDIQDPVTNQPMSIRDRANIQLPLSQGGEALSNQVRDVKLSGVEGLSYTHALARAQARANVSYENVVVAEGELDAVIYGGILKARSLVGVKGAGRSYDGLYYVKQVTHQLGKGYYQQKFKLNRDGLGSTVDILF